MYVQYLVKFCTFDFILELVSHDDVTAILSDSDHSNTSLSAHQLAHLLSTRLNITSPSSARVDAASGQQPADSVWIVREFSVGQVYNASLLQHVDVIKAAAQRGGCDVIEHPLQELQPVS